MNLQWRGLVASSLFLYTCFSPTTRPKYNSKPRLLNLILLNLIVRWPTGAAIARLPNTEYTQSIGVCWEKLPKIVQITLLQFNYEFGHGNFFTVWSS